MYRRIVVALDGSELAERALEHAESLARLSGAPLHLVRVIDPTNLGSSGTVALYAGVAAFQKLLADERITCREYLERVKQELVDRELEVTVEHRDGVAASELLAAIRPGDLVVMATHGRGGMERWFLGSVAEAVTRRAPVPVLLVREEPDATATSLRVPER